MSPLNGILVSTRRHASAPAHAGAACTALLLALAFACRSAAAAEPPAAHTIRDADVRRAEKILSKLRLLHDAAGADDAGSYRKLTSRLYPGLFVKVAEIRPGDLSTDLSTAVFLAEKLGRTWSAAGQAAECRSERPDIYLPLCLGLRGGTVRQLLLAKSRLHARWAEAVVRNSRGEADPETSRALAEMEAARVNDLLIAARVVEMLKTPEGRPPSRRRTQPAESSPTAPASRTPCWRGCRAARPSTTCPARDSRAPTGSGGSRRYGSRRGLWSPRRAGSSPTR